MKRLAYIIFVLFFYVSLADDYKYSDRNAKKIYKVAELNYYEKEYLNALSSYLLLDSIEGGNVEVIYKTGVCYIQSGEDLRQGINYLSKYKSLKKSKSLPSDFYINMGQAYHQIHKFDLAIINYNNYIKNAGSSGDSIELARQYINMCHHGKYFFAHPHDVTIENVGPAINSEYPDYVPVISTDESIMIFTSRRPGSTGGGIALDGYPYEDVYISENVNDRWSLSEKISSNINTKFHDASVSLSADGNDLIIYNSLDGGLFISSRDGNKWSEPEPLTEKINSSNSNELSACFSFDGKTVYFSSDRQGGFGGRDIYKITRDEDNNWGEVENLGEAINTKYDEDGIFIHPDNRTFFFSSKGHNSMGGYDIFKSVLEDGQFSTPRNLGYPINTAGDDIYFVLAASGRRGYYSSERPGGYGEKDIYVITLMDSANIPLTMLRGKLLDGHTLKPISAKLKVVDVVENKEIKYVYNPNKETGEYLMIFPPGRSYELVIQAEGYLNYLIDIDVPDQYKFHEIHQEIYLTNKDSAGGGNIGEEIVIKNAFFDIKGSTEILPMDYERQNLSNLLYDIILSDSKEGLDNIDNILEGNYDAENIYKRNVNDLTTADGKIDSIQKEVLPIVNTNLKYLEDIDPFEQELIYGKNDTNALKPLVLGSDTIYVAEVYNQLDSIYKMDTAKMSPTLKSLKLIKDQEQLKHYIDISGVVIKESDVSGIKVLLLDDYGDKLDSTYTNFIGFYIFDSLNADYIYKVKILDDEEFSSKAFVTDESGVIIKTGTVHLAPIAFENSDHINHIDVFRPSDIENLNKKLGSLIVGNLIDKTAPPLGCVDVFAYLFKNGTIIDSTLTDAKGDFTFYNVDISEEYQVKFAANTKGGEQYKNSSDVYTAEAFAELLMLDNKHEVVKTSSEEKKDNAGFYNFVDIIGDFKDRSIPRVNISGVVLLDENTDYASVLLLDGRDQAIDSTLTNIMGYYVFYDLPDTQDYSVMVREANNDLGACLMTDESGAIKKNSTKVANRAYFRDLNVGLNSIALMDPATHAIGKFTGAYSMQGKVVDRDNIPVGVKDVQVDLYIGENNKVKSTQTDEDGEFMFDSLDVEEEYLVKVANTSKGSDSYLNRLDEYVENIMAEMIIINDNNEVEKTSSDKQKNDHDYFYFIDTDKELAKEGALVNISGIVLLNDNVDFATVYLLNSNKTLVDSMNTDILGYYEFVSLPPDNYMVNVREHHGQLEESFVTNDQNEILKVSEKVGSSLAFSDPDEELNNLTLMNPSSKKYQAFSGASSIQGKLADKNNLPLGIKDVKVDLYSADDEEVIKTVYSNDKGEFVFDSLDITKDYLVQVDENSNGNDGYINQLDNLVESLMTEMVFLNENEQVIKTSSNDNQDAQGRFYFVQTTKDHTKELITISGIALLNDGVDYASVFLLDASGNVMDSVNTDLMGYYEFVDLIKGNYSVEVLDREAKLSRSVVKNANNEVFKMDVANNHSDIKNIEHQFNDLALFSEEDEIEEESDGRVLKGKLTDKDNVPVGVKNVKVDLYEQKSGAKVDSTLTDDNGEFVFRNLKEEEEYKVRVGENSEGADSYLNKLDEYVDELFAEMLIMNHHHAEKTSSENEKDKGGFYSFIDIKKTPVKKMPESIIVYFGFDQSSLTSTDISKINSVINVLKEDAKLNINIIGHTDTVGAYSYNMYLGERRAKSVAGLILKSSIAKSRVNVSSKGEQAPFKASGIIDNAKSRRVEIGFLKL